MVSARKRAVRNLHVPLSDELHREIREEAERTGQPATVLVREAVEAWLTARRRAALHEELAEYASRWAGTEVDLDPELEAVSVEQLRVVPRKRR